MIVNRFCSRRELELLRAGETLHNDTDHYRGGRGGSTSIGFCFTTDRPEEAWKYLKGVVTPEVCVTYDIARYLLHASRGRYRDTSVAADPLRPAGCLREEWCTTTLKLDDEVKLLRVLPIEAIASSEDMQAIELMAELAAARQSRQRRQP